jgi:hypothetical protein
MVAAIDANVDTFGLWAQPLEPPLVPPKIEERMKRSHQLLIP